MSLPRFATRRPVAIAVLFLAIALLGAIAYVRLPIDLLPDLRFPKLVIYTSYADAAPAEVERLVTAPIEAQAAAVPGTQKVTSVSREGVSLVTLRFAWGTDMDFALLNARERMDDLRDVLPIRATRPRLLRVDPDSDPILALAVSGPSDLWATKELAETVIRRRLEQLDGVARAAIVGGLDREIEVQVDPERLRTYGLTSGDVSAALERANASAPGGMIRQGRYRYPLRTLGELGTVREIEEVVVDASSRVVRLEDVAIVTDGFAERESIARLDGREAVGLVLFKEAGANTVGVARAVDEVIAQLEREHPTLRIDVVSSQAGFVSATIDNLGQEVIVGAILAFLVLFLFLRDPRYPVVVALAIPASVLATFALLEASGVSLNVMSLGGLALGVGMLTDNSIVVLENIFRHREMGASAMEAAAAGAEEVSGAVSASTLTTIGVFFPIVYVEGVAGQLFRDLSLAVAYSLLTSLLVALTLLPAWAARSDLGLHGAAQPAFRAFDLGFARLTHRYHVVLHWALDRPWRTLAWSGVALALAVAAGLELPRELLPRVDQGSFEARIQLPPGADLQATANAAARVEAALRGDVGVDVVFSRIGRDVRAYGEGEERADVNAALLQVRVVAREQTARVMERVRSVAARLPGATVTVAAGRATTLGRILGGDGSDVAVRIRAEDLVAAHARADEVASRLAPLARLNNVRIGAQKGTPEIRVEILRDRAAAHGIDPGEIADAVEQATRGIRATDFVDFDRKIAVMVRYPERVRSSRSILETLSVQGVPLRELVSVHEVVGPAEVRREDQGRVLTVHADVASGGVDAAIAAVRGALRDLPPVRDLRMEVGGENEEMRRSFRELLLAFLLASALVYMVLAAELESFAHPFIILMTVPLSLIGALLALVVTKQSINTMSLIGLVVLIGIVDNDAVVKVDFIRRARAAGMGVRDAILEAGRVRLRPIVMTGLATILGLLPMAFGIGSGGAFQAPMAIVVIGGLTVATLLTLVVIPVLYLLIEERPSEREERRPREGAALFRPEGPAGDYFVFTSTRMTPVPSPSNSWSALPSTAPISLPRSVPFMATPGSDDVTSRSPR